MLHKLHALKADKMLYKQCFWPHLNADWGKKYHIKISGVPQGSVLRFASISHIYQMIFRIAWCHRRVNDKDVTNDTKLYFSHSSGHIASFARSLSAFCDWSSNW